MPTPRCDVNKRIAAADVDRLETWVKYRPSLCAGCAATCCSLPVEVRISDLVRLRLIDAFAAEEPPKQLAKQLQKAGLIDHFSFARGIFTLAQRSNGDCIFLDAQTRRCSVYENRPDTCRNHPTIGPRPGYCAYRPK